MSEGIDGLKISKNADVLREIAPDLWVAEQPHRYAGFEMGRRMSVARLAGGSLWVHSPLELSGSLREELNGLGEVRFVMPASVLHGHLAMPEYRRAYPRAALLGVPGLERKHRHLRFDANLPEAGGAEWAGEIELAPFEGYRIGSRVLNEVEFFHPKTRTLITGDLCFNIGPQRPLATRFLAWGPRMRRRFGPTVAFRYGIRDRRAAQRSLERILAWDFDRIIPGHGETVDTGGRALFKRAFEELLAGE